MPDQASQEPWQWPEPHWRGLVDQVRAGRRYRPARWKNGARAAFALSFDADHETNELRDGGKSIGRLAWGSTAPASACRASSSCCGSTTCPPPSTCPPLPRCCMRRSSDR
ncbi:hypothetical protein ACFQU7_33530 [Pseudoroseomonas wenyumeiae]